MLVVPGPLRFVGDAHAQVRGADLRLAPETAAWTDVERQVEVVLLATQAFVQRIHSAVDVDVARRARAHAAAGVAHACAARLRGLEDCRPGRNVCDSLFVSRICERYFRHVKLPLVFMDDPERDRATEVKFQHAVACDDYSAQHESLAGSL